MYDVVDFGVTRYLWGSFLLALHSCLVVGFVLVLRSLSSLASFRRPYVSLTSAAPLLQRAHAPPTVHALHMGLSSVIFPSLDSLGLQHQNCLLLRVRVTLRPCCTAMRCAPMCVVSHLSYQLVVCLSFSHPFVSDVFVRCVDVFIYLFVGFDLCQITVCVNRWDQLSLGRRGLRAAFFPSS